MSASFTLRATRSQHIYFGVAESLYYNTAHLPAPRECTNLGPLMIQAILLIRKKEPRSHLPRHSCSNLDMLMIQEVSVIRKWGYDLILKKSGSCPPEITIIYCLSSILSLKIQAPESSRKIRLLVGYSEILLP